MSELRVITGSATDFDIGAVMLRRVRVGGTANLTGTVIIKRGTTTLETIPSAATPGTERAFAGLRFGSAAFDILRITMAQAADTVLVEYD